MVQTWDGEKTIQKSWIFLVDHFNRSVSQIPQRIKHPTMHHFVTEMCTFLLQSGALRDMGLVHCGNYKNCFRDYSNLFALRSICIPAGTVRSGGFAEKFGFREFFTQTGPHDYWCDIQIRPKSVENLIEQPPKSYNAPVPWPTNVPFRTEMCTFLFWMVHCGISYIDWGIWSIYLTNLYKYFSEGHTDCRILRIISLQEMRCKKWVCTI